MAELRSDDSDIATQVEDAINQACRFIDNWKARDYFLHDYTQTELSVDQYDRAIDGDSLWFPHTPTIEINSVTVADEEWTEDEDYLVKECRLIAIGTSSEWTACPGRWPLIGATDRVVINGLFGYMQPRSLSSAVIVAGGTGYTVNDVLTVVGGTASQAAQITVSAVSGGIITAFTVTRAGSYTAVPSSPVSVTGGTGSGATFTPTWGIMTAVVPTGIPDNIVRAAVLIAAAFSGHNQKEIVGLDGNKEQVTDKAISSTAYKILGARAVVI